MSTELHGKIQQFLSIFPKIEGIPLLTISWQFKEIFFNQLRKTVCLISEHYLILKQINVVLKT